jgi:hypothetical protein
MSLTVRSILFGVMGVTMQTMVTFGAILGAWNGL